MLISDFWAISLIFVFTIIVICGIIAIKFVFLAKRKKENSRIIKLDNYVVTISGICGKIVAVQKKDNIVFAILQTGDKTHKSFVTVDADSIYQIVEEPDEIIKDEKKVE